ncbi:MAG TPA: RNA polymerase subunit sigma-70 [Nannocystaceae bacterium]|nr:RNA polymerase subunit sigma-70 [Nannocystaceae bacterium]
MSESIDHEFSTAVAPLRGALRLDCYRMLGSAHDSDDLVQETLLRAWRSRHTLLDRTRLRPWLYRIATHACFDELARRPKRVLASDLQPAADPRADAAPPIDEAVWLEPMPDAWLGNAAGDPDARYTLRESVALAFVAALQVLSPAQRAALLLRDVVGLSADETAAALEQSVSATNSALHRARTAIDEKVAREGPEAFATTPQDQAVLAAYVRAIAECDVEAMIALMHDDLHTTMPPSPTWIAGRAANEVFYRKMFARWRLGDVKLVPLGANGQHGFAFWREGSVRAIEVVELRDGLIARVHHFMQPGLVPLFVDQRDT